MIDENVEDYRVEGYCLRFYFELLRGVDGWGGECRGL